ncbi:phage baseplate protein [Enterobacter roggenkampii]|uniref:phage baseplate protein n=1 Tax=Enterobacter roggenkampii TaxID=1812935 RepID=UPI000B215F2A|nr:hypothetical protein [Enterobacter roggenkampii]
MLDINVASIKTSVRFVVSKEDIAEAKRAASDLKKAFEKIQDPKMNFKRMKENTGIRREADITSYPVESGAEVSDHVQIKNNTFKLSGIISETPLRLEKDLLYSAGVNGTRISQAIEYLDKMFDSRQPITLVTEQKVYENVILSGISYDYKSEYAMQFDLEFEQIRLVSKATVNVIATKTQGNKSVGGTVKQKVVNNAPKKTESDTVTTEFKK